MLILIFYRNYFSFGKIIKKLSSVLEKITKNKWLVKVSDEEGEKTIVEKENIELETAKEKIRLNPDIAEVFNHFPEAKIISIKD